MTENPKKSNIYNNNTNLTQMIDTDFDVIEANL